MSQTQTAAGGAVARRADGSVRRAGGLRGQRELRGQRGLRGQRELRGLRGSPVLTLLAVALGVMMVALDGTIVSVANPAIQSHLGASLAGIQWVTNGYLLALTVALITM